MMHIVNLRFIKSFHRLNKRKYRTKITGRLIVLEELDIFLHYNFFCFDRIDGKLSLRYFMTKITAKNYRSVMLLYKFKNILTQ